MRKSAVHGQTKVERTVKGASGRMRREGES